METDERKFKKIFPYLAQELKRDENKISIASVRSEIEKGYEIASKHFNGYNPNAIDFLRRCNNEKQAGEIIEYLVKRKEISHDYAVRLRKQLKKKGLESFGPKKEEDYYIKKASSKSN